MFAFIAILSEELVARHIIFDNTLIQQHLSTLMVKQCVAMFALLQCTYPYLTFIMLSTIATTSNKTRI